MRSIVTALLLLLPFMGPYAIIAASKQPHIRQNDKANNFHDRFNRQLLEHGLRGGNENNYVNSSEFAADTNYTIPVANTTVPLHAHSGTHHVHLYVGSPPQRQTLIVDTGSRTMAFPCRTCPTCNDCCGTHASPYFDPSKSSTHFVSSCGSCLLEGISDCPMQLLSGRRTASAATSIDGGDVCTFAQKYTEGSAWRATEVEDLVWLGSSDVVESIENYMPSLAVAYPFGCQTSSTGLFRKQYADGILGLTIHETSLVTAFYNEGLIRSDAFSLCFTQEGGVLSLGGSLDPHKFHHSQGMKRTPISKHEHGYYSVEVIRLVVGNNTIVTDINTKPRLLREINAGKGCILDSGTTDSYFPESLLRPIRRAVLEYGKARSGEITGEIPVLDDHDLDLFSPKLRERPYTYQEFEVLLPTVTLVFANEVALNILPKHYMENVPLDASSGNVVPWEGTLILTNRLYFEEENGSVLGANAFFGYDILFDATNELNKQQGMIGIAPSDCHAAAKDIATLPAA